MATPTVPLLTLNNGVELPSIGFGVFQTPPDETIAAVEAALNTGYRHIDTAAAYGNEREVGEGIRRVRSVPRGGVRRDEDLDQRLRLRRDPARLRQERRQARRRSARSADPASGAPQRVRQDDRRIRGAREAARRREGACDRGQQLHARAPDPLLQETDVVPAVNQIELHPYFQQRELQALHAEHGILTQAWSPIGGITSYREGGKSAFEDPTILEIAAAHGKSAAQVMLRWHLQEGRSAIPKSTKPARIAENFDVFDFELTGDEIAALDALDTGIREAPSPRTSPSRASAARSPKRDRPGWGRQLDSHPRPDPRGRKNDEPSLPRPGRQQRRRHAPRTLWSRIRRGTWLQDHDCGLGRPKRRKVVQPRVDLAPFRPKTRAFVPLRCTGVHEARAVANDDLRIRLGLEIEPPRRLRVCPTVHGHRDEVRTVFEVAEDHRSIVAGAAPSRCQVQRPPTVGFRAPQSDSSTCDSVHAPVNVPGEAHEPARRNTRSSCSCVRHGWSLVVRDCPLASTSSLLSVTRSRIMWICPPFCGIDNIAVWWDSTEVPGALPRIATRHDRRWLPDHERIRPPRAR